MESQLDPATRRSPRTLIRTVSPCLTQPPSPFSYLVVHVRYSLISFFSLIQSSRRRTVISPRVAISTAIFFAAPLGKASLFQDGLQAYSTNPEGTVGQGRHWPQPPHL